MAILDGHSVTPESLTAILWNRDEIRRDMLKIEKEDKEWICEFLKFSDLDIVEYREYYTYLHMLRIKSLDEIDSDSRDFKYLSKVEYWIKKFNEEKSKQTIEEENDMERMIINGQRLSKEDTEIGLKIMIAMELADVENKGRNGRKKTYKSYMRLSSDEIRQRLNDHCGEEIW